MRFPTWFASAILVLLVILSGAPPDARAPSAQAAPLTEMTLQFVGYLGGENRAVFVQGNYAYAALGQELAVLNIANPAQPTRVGSLVFDEDVRQVHVVGNYAYLLSNRYAYGGTLRVINVASPAQPMQVGSYIFSGGPSGDALGALYVSGNYAYVTAQGTSFTGLRIINIANPVLPTLAGSWNSQPFRPYRVFVAGQYAYVTGDEGNTNTNGLRVVNISQPATPQQVGALVLPGFVSGIFVSGNYAYLADYDLSRLRVVNIVNPTIPQEIRSLELFLGTFGGTKDIFVSGNYAYVSGAASIGGKMYGGVDVVDVSNPASSLSLVGDYVTSEITDPGDIYFAANYVYLATGDHGLRTFSVSDPAHPTPAGRYKVLESPEGISVPVAPASPQRNAATAYAYIADWGIKVVDITSPSLPSIVGAYVAPPPIAEGGALDVSGGYAYYTSDACCLRVINVSTPTNPSAVGFYDPPGAPYNLDVAGNYAYIVDGNLRVVDVSNPASPTQIGSFDAAWGAQTVAISGTYAYLVGNGLRVLNISNPASPTQVGATLESLTVNDVALDGARAYLASNNGLRVIDISNPISPTQVGTALQPSSIGHVAVSGNYAFAILSDSLRMLDISNPSAPVQVLAYTTPTLYHEVYANGEYIFLTGSGMFTLRQVPLALQATPTALTFMAQVGGANPVPRTISVTSNGRALNWTSSISPTVGWLNVAPTSGATSSNITVTPNISGLSIGQYQTQLRVQASDPVQNSPQTIPVTLNVVQTLRTLYLPLVLR